MPWWSSETMGDMTTTTAPPRRRRPRRSVGRRLTSLLGALLIVVGLGLIGWFAWQYFGTNIVAKQAQTQIKQATVAEWDNGIEGEAVALVRIPRFGQDFEMPVLKGWDQAQLAKGIGMYEKSSKPGAIGNFVIAGHRVTHGEPFRDFLKLRAGDLVEVETRQKIYTYKLEGNGDAITVDFTTSWPLWKVPDKDWDNSPPTEAKITLLTCSELFHTRNRNVVVGDLVKTIDKATTQPPPDRVKKTPAPEGDA